MSIRKEKFICAVDLGKGPLWNLRQRNDWEDWCFERYSLNVRDSYVIGAPPLNK